MLLIFDNCFHYLPELLITLKSGAYQVLYGVVILFVLYLISMFLGLKMLSGILGSMRNFWILALIFLFQPELRTMLARLSMGKELTGQFRRLGRATYYSTLVDSISSMSFRKTWTLIVLETNANS
jgi:diadenylate cyclase